MRVLVAEDDWVMAVLLEELLTGWGHEVTVVHDGASAWRELCSRDIRVLISDWQMPGVDGPELCRRVRSGALERYVYSILLTGREGVDQLIEGLDSGADDFIRKSAFNPAELKARVRAGERIVRLHNELESRNRELSQAVETMRLDLDAAASVQKGLLPADATVAGTISFSSLFCPSAQVSGDIFNVVPLSRDRCAFYLIDVAGHGVPASLTAVSLSNLLTRDFLVTAETGGPGGLPTASVSQVVSQLNERYRDDCESGTYFTMVYGLYDARARCVRFCMAGHPLPILVPESGEPVSVARGGMPVGLFADSVYETYEVSVRPGDRLFLYSDGITECMNADGDQFGEAQLIAHLARMRTHPIGEVLAGIEASVFAWRGTGALEDDLSMLALDVLSCDEPG